MIVMQVPKILYLHLKMLINICHFLFWAMEYPFITRKKDP